MRVLKRIIWTWAIALLVFGCRQDPFIAPSGKIIKIGIIAPLQWLRFCQGR
jgi:hypothetical protein